ncbi:unnamed protein product (mitochondrion) [Plasmodiophora brassicae]|uniref:DUF72 domain-containing protein n=1 Tax=Plasmodiophora brassicae TaxID=37360 RepID=A0A0G4J5N3_PLABS|nr:hypothetical protein PBRA_002631 [Plasmodiophora brassicae]SPQ94792.1 unnamed protein product [Plasmodiophora brassicae]
MARGKVRARSGGQGADEPALKRKATISKITDVVLGTSGYSYGHWRGKYYPPGADMFTFYANEFDAVELNAPFYRVPARTTWEKWATQAPRPSFVYAVKANRFFTHMKQLNVDNVFRERWTGFYDEGCKLLGPHLGPVLFQLAPRSKCSLSKLKSLAGVLPRGGHFVFEFRHASWLCNDVYDILRENQWCLALLHVNNRRKWAGDLRTGWNPPLDEYDSCCDWGAYVRLHGTTGQYVGSYSEESIRQLSDKVRDWRDEGKRVYVMCNNTDDGTPPSAVADLRHLKERLQRG